MAGQLASQPVGITGEPVSATASLASPPDRGAARSDRANRKRKRDTQGGREQGALPGRSSAATGTTWAGPADSSSGTGYSGSGGGSAGAGGAGSPVSGGSGSGKDYDGDDGHEYEDDSYEDDDYEDDD